ncbi:DUF2971 domain-containing protein [Endozoicomonas numazuensis]|uniref:DUF2971 domain-containing protein n=1 Tax=Endozoicomonas numazuensis TaxID=1137799 RepID=A0A081NLN0_9GAMM|nr:DUF2971 domain-containing protein [Endozoicomonas numazuensis]KEQ19353.1 hypothetical protein GZ78_05145 [Endozoicomonas numazuensis]
MSTENSNQPISLFKFRAGNDNDLDALHQDYIWFPSCASLNDPFEGMAFIDSSNIDSRLYQKFRDKFNEKCKETSGRHRCDDHLDDKEFVHQWFKAYVEAWRQKTAIFSASKAYSVAGYRLTPEHVLGSMALWGHYADGLRGYCIEYNFEQLEKSLKDHNPERGIGSSGVEYSNTLRPILSLKTYIEDYVSGDRINTVTEIQKTFTTKHKSTWHHEQEARLFAAGKDGKCEFDSSCIRAVYLGEKMSDEKKRSIKACLDAKPVKIDLCEVSIDKLGREYQLRIGNYSG